MDAKKLIELIEDSGDYRAQSYSGRAMYGKNCVGVRIRRDKSVFEFVADLLETVDAHSDGEDELSDNISEVASVLRRARTDGMGLDTILYFPRIEWEGDNTDEEPDDYDDDDGLSDAEADAITLGERDSSPDEE
jgi:hypothetical protein